MLSLDELHANFLKRHWMSADEAVRKHLRGFVDALREDWAELIAQAEAKIAEDKAAAEAEAQRIAADLAAAEPAPVGDAQPEPDASPEPPAVADVPVLTETVPAADEAKSEPAPEPEAPADPAPESVDAAADAEPAKAKKSK